MKTQSGNVVGNHTHASGSMSIPATLVDAGHRYNQAITEAIAAQEATQWTQDIPNAPVYQPTAKEWEDPLSYIRSIQSEAARYGVCIIKSPIPPAVTAGMVLGQQQFRFNTRQQEVVDQDWQDWNKGTVFWQQTKRYTPREFQTYADEVARRELGGLHASLPPGTIESAYWRQRSSNSTSNNKKSSKSPLIVQYGNDIDGTAFHPGDALGQSKWNLNTLPSLDGCALRWSPISMPGVTSPMLYIGMLYSTFCWHVEDHFLYSINYHHAGSAKIWYGVPASDADALESAAADTVYKVPCSLDEKLQTDEQKRLAASEALMKKTTMFSPKILKDRGVSVYRAVQEAGSYIVTFPRAYHSGFGCGFNIGEAVNFAMGDWWPYAVGACRLYRSLHHGHIILHEQALCSEALHLFESQSLEELESDASTMAVFVETFKKQHSLRRALEQGGASAVSCCASGVLAESASVSCSSCGHLCYMVSVVVDPCGPHTLWKHTCLECCSTATNSDDVDINDNKNSLIFVKPLWSRLEEACIKFYSILVSQAIGPLLPPSLPLDGAHYNPPAIQLPINPVLELPVLQDPVNELPGIHWLLVASNIEVEAPSNQHLEQAAELKQQALHNDDGTTTLLPVLTMSTCIPARFEMLGDNTSEVLVPLELPNGRVLVSTRLEAIYRAMLVEAETAARCGDTTGPWVAEFYSLVGDLDAQLRAWHSLTNTSMTTTVLEKKRIKLPWLTPHDVWAAATLAPVQEYAVETSTASPIVVDPPVGQKQKQPKREKRQRPSSTQAPLTTPITHPYSNAVYSTRATKKIKPKPRSKPKPSHPAMTKPRGIELLGIDTLVLPSPSSALNNETFTRTRLLVNGSIMLVGLEIIKVIGVNLKRISTYDYFVGVLRAAGLPVDNLLVTDLHGLDTGVRRRKDLLLLGRDQVEAVVDSLKDGTAVKNVLKEFCAGLWDGSNSEVVTPQLTAVTHDVVAVQSEVAQYKVE